MSKEQVIGFMLHKDQDEEIKRKYNGVVNKYEEEEK
jgi:hypothetical protein